MSWFPSLSSITISFTSCCIHIPVPLPSFFEFAMLSRHCLHISSSSRYHTCQASHPLSSVHSNSSVFSSGSNTHPLAHRGGGVVLLI